MDNTSVHGLRMSLSGYVGNSFRNTMAPTSDIKGIHGTVSIGSFDFAYNDYNIVARGHFDYGHLSDSKRITDFNMQLPSKSPSKRQKVASDVITTGIEAGYNMFSLSKRLTQRNQRLYVFGRYDYYDSMYKMERNLDDKWCGRRRIAVGINYYPINQIVIKGEYAIGLLSRPFNNEPSVSLGIAYSGWFL